MAKKYNTALDFYDKVSKVRIFPFMKATEFAKLSPTLKQELVGKKPV